MGSGASLESGSDAPITLAAQELSEADDSLWRGALFADAETFPKIVGYVATTSFGSVEYTAPLRHIPARDPTNAIALCLHGYGEDRCMALWSRFWEPMRQRGFHILTLDLPGFGRASNRILKAPHDGELLLRLLACLSNHFSMPEATVSVFAEGIGACAFLRAYAQDPRPFAAHHVLLNVQIGEIPRGLQENLESRGAAIMLCACEKFFSGQPPWLLAGINQISQLLMDPSTMGLLGTVILWKVEDASGPSPFKSMRHGLWWTGSLEQCALTPAGQALIFAASVECFEELLDYVSAPPRKVSTKKSQFGPERTAIDMGKINDTFSVFIRIRPLLERERRAGAGNCLFVSDTDFPRDPPPQRVVVEGSESIRGLKGNYVFNRVFQEETNQEAVYNASVKAYVKDFLAGTNVTIFAYGQTGTGKTYTISGPREDPGIVSRCLLDIFQSLPGNAELHYEYVQLYLDEFKDLLVKDGGIGKLVEDKGGVSLSGVSSQRAVSSDDVLGALAAGATRRVTRAQEMNDVSSRSHAILMLHLKTADETLSSMFVVDLAGSERVERSGVTGEAFAEATNVNLSLTALGRVVVTLIEESKAFIPYNGSPLTMLLKAGLGGNSKTALVACVSPSADSIHETLSTLHFAMQASHVKNKVEGKEAQDRAFAEKQRIAEAGNDLVLLDGKGSVKLPSGCLEVWGSWPVSEETAILLGGLGGELDELQELFTALAEKKCRVLAPKLPGTAEKHLDSDVAILLELCDWLGVAKPVIYGSDWGAIRAIKYKISHPMRAGSLILENKANKMDEAQYKARIKKDPSYSLQEYMGAWLWMYDGAFPKSLDGSAVGNNMKGFKGKVDFLWPCHFKGKHDPTRKRVAEPYARALRTKAIDSYFLTAGEIASKISASFA